MIPIVFCIVCRMRPGHYVFLTARALEDGSIRYGQERGPFLEAGIARAIKDIAQGHQCLIAADPELGAKISDSQVVVRDSRRAYLRALLGGAATALYVKFSGTVTADIARQDSVTPLDLGLSVPLDPSVFTPSKATRLAALRKAEAKRFAIVVAEYAQGVNIERIILHGRREHDQFLYSLQAEVRKRWPQPVAVMIGPVLPHEVLAAFISQELPRLLRGST